MTPELAVAWAELGIPFELLQSRNLTLFTEATELIDVAVSDDGRIWQLIPAAAAAWAQMQRAAWQDGVDLQIASAYRASTRQVELIQRKLIAGVLIDEVLQVLAPPGCSEHHTGRAVDIFTPGGPVVTEEFENTPAFAWLNSHAAEFGFTLSFPRDNRYGYVYEPWHWCWADKNTPSDAVQHFADQR
ncbi:M15 family metallopeptidase [Deefgea piscis]|nr:M15 family metallopeptidase [Deefgea piscis]